MFLVDRAVVSIPGLCRCPGDEQQEDQEEERCFVAHGEGFLFLVKLPASALRQE